MSIELTPEQRCPGSSSRQNSYRFHGSLRRFWTFGWSRHRNGDDAHPDVPGLAKSEAEEGQSPGLPWSELEVLFGEDVQTSVPETADAEGDSASPPAMKWSKSNIIKLIDAFSQGVLSNTNEHGMTLVHLTLMGQQIKCAKLLFDYAAEQGKSVSLRWRNGDILGWSMDNKSGRLAEFILQQMTGQCSSPEETARCLGDHFERLVKQFPQVMQKYIINDKFCFEYGRFDVPQSLFADRPDAPIAVLDAAPSSWKPAEGSDGIKDFWKQKGIADFIDLDSTSDIKIPAATKFLCVDLSNTQDQQTVVKSLLSANYPADVFKTQSTKELIQWAWTRLGNSLALFALCLSLSSAILFFVAAAIFGIEEDGTDAAALRFCRSLFFVATLNVLPIPLTGSGKHRFLMFATGLYLFIHSCVIDHHTDFSFFLTSLQCILYLYTLVEDLRPYAMTGPFISMIGYVLVDIRPFVILGILMITTFGIAFRVLFADSFDEDDGQGFNSPWRSFESMFYATLGQFDTEVFYTPSTTFLTVWRSFLFYLFLFFATIVLLSLLIAVLGDTCDRVMLTREAELFKSRAWWTSKSPLLWRARARQEEESNQEGVSKDDFSWGFAVLFSYPFLLFRIGLGIGLASGTAWEVAIIGAIYTVQQIAFFTVVYLPRNVLHIPCYKRVGFEDRLFRKLNSSKPKSGLSIIWFLVAVTPVASTIDTVWHGRLVALENMISRRLKETEENLGAALQQQRQETQDRLARIEGFLELVTQPTP